VIELLKKYNVKVICNKNGEWFSANDLGEVLEIKNIRDSLRKVKEKYKIKFNNSNVEETDIKNFKESLPNRGTTFIKSQAVYQIAFRSNKPEAMEFTEWVSDVIELIRQNGYYIATEKDKMWLGIREEGKQIRVSETDEIKQFVEYAKGQGSSKPTFYYNHFTNLVRKKLDIPKELKRDDMKQELLWDIKALERIITMKLPKLINKEMDYKEIYSKIKELINEI